MWRLAFVLVATAMAEGERSSQSFGVFHSGPSMGPPHYEQPPPSQLESQSFGIFHPGPSTGPPHYELSPPPPQKSRRLLEGGAATPSAPLITEPVEDPIPSPRAESLVVFHSGPSYRPPPPPVPPSISHAM
ncbi:hypothetical protein L6164_035394 [Bauhinia variegata]|uniref:Uncharacterized protein n=1 Tax=Bauhinia variegata TaxID=167791 RepID=A0ACB9KDV4_BAUVA|nr:hypothetical protein L6164_035394 [Bauhinia variegata]